MVLIKRRILIALRRRTRSIMHTVANALLCLLLAISLAPASQLSQLNSHAAARDKQILYVMNYHEAEEAKKEVPPNPTLIKTKEDVLADDYKMVEHLKGLGFTVTTCDEGGSLELTKGKDLIIVAESVNANEIGPKYTDVPIPVIVFENDLFDDFKMTGKRLNIDFGTERTTRSRSLRFYNPAHPLSAGLPPGVQEIYTEPREINWGRPSPGATVIATVADNPEKVAFFGYEKAATMDSDYAAPARRVALFMWQDMFRSLNSQGRALLDSAVSWAISPPAALSAEAAAKVPGAVPIQRYESTIGYVIANPTGSSARGKQLLYIMNLHEADALKAEAPNDPARIKRREELLAEDNRIVDHFKSLGFTVTVADEHPSGNVANGKDLIIISDSVVAAQIQGKYRSLSIPVVTWASDLYPYLGLTGTRAGRDYGTTGTPGGKDGDRFAMLFNAAHPLDAGLRTDLIQDYYDDNEYVTNWGMPSLGAINIATIAGYPDRRIIFAYEKGSCMTGDLVAPGKRVGLFLSTHDFEHLQKEGMALLDAAVLWAVAP
jgi:hypothetical protein